MRTSILSLTIQRPRDILLGQVRCRQLCRVLGFDLEIQARIVCAFFNIADERRRMLRQCRILVELDNRSLIISSEPLADYDDVDPSAPAVHMSIPLPENELRMTSEDLVWTMKQLASNSKVSLYDEIRQQNNDLLRALLTSGATVSSSDLRRFRVIAA